MQATESSDTQGIGGFMETRPPVFLFLLFLEEFIFWVPGSANTIIQRLALLAVNSTQGITEQPIDYEFLVLMNPGVAIFLFLISSGGTMHFLRSLLASWTSTDLILFINRHSIIRIVISAAIGLWLLQQLLAVLSSSDVHGLMDLYQYKQFWIVLFVGIAAYQFTSPSK